MGVVMTDTILEIDNLAKDFRTNKGDLVEALAGVTIEVKQNDFICIVGPSGCGKSTMLRIIAGLEKATGGTALYKQNAIERPAAQIGMVFQEYSLLPWRTVLDNVALGLEFAGLGIQQRLSQAMEYVQLVGLTDFIHAFPHELSGGMRQRVAIARAMAVEPEILLMDEPFGALDAHTRILLQKELLKVWEAHRKTVLFVTHSVDEAIFLADKILVMSKRPGRIKTLIDVDMPRPRNRALARYGQLYASILDMLDE